MIQTNEQETDHERQVWASMPHRALTALAKIFLWGKSAAAFGEPSTQSLSLAPPEWAHRLWMDSPRCPVCGQYTREFDRVPARLHLNYETGLHLGLGVWVHRACFEACPDAGQPAPVPW